MKYMNKLLALSWQRLVVCIQNKLILVVITHMNKLTNLNTLEHLAVIKVGIIIIFNLDFLDWMA